MVSGISCSTRLPSNSILLCVFAISVFFLFPASEYLVLGLRFSNPSELFWVYMPKTGQGPLCLAATPKLQNVGVQWVLKLAWEIAHCITGINSFLSGNQLPYRK